MTIYVIEREWDSTCQLGWSTDKNIAKRKKRMYEERGVLCWITEYHLDKDGYCEFNLD